MRAEPRTRCVLLIVLLSIISMSYVNNVYSKVAKLQSCKVALSVFLGAFFAFLISFSIIIYIIYYIYYRAILSHSAARG